MMYPKNDSLQKFIDQKLTESPLYNFSTTNREQHFVWQINDENELNFLQQTFKNFPHLFIADGHHRSASSQLLLEKSGANATDAMHYFMSFLICETCIQINEYNRVVHDLNGMNADEFITTLSENYIVKKEHEFWRPTTNYTFGMYLEGTFYSLTLKNKPNTDNIVEQLDTQILYNTILHPLLNIKDLRTDTRISYIPGNKNILEMVNKVDDGEYKVGFILYPASVSDIKALADHELTMPPKSTYIEPKLRSGLIVYEF